LSYTCFEPGGSSSGRHLYVQLYHLEDIKIKD